MKKAIFLMLGMALFVAPAVSFADESAGEKVEEAAKDTKRAVKKGARNVKNKTCEMVNGKLDCAVKKAKNSAKNAGDKVEDALD